jgi:D-alanyl-lipoteichoic acid acyltransferase DltB (MBOAT superfamily)
MLFFTFNFTALADGVGALAALVGFEVEPVFQAPLLSRSPREFWSRRWNKFVARFLLRHVALSLPRRWPAPVIVLCVFAVSGLLHEYFAWGSAGEHWVAGDMLVFFLAQGLAVIAELRVPVRAPRKVGIVTTFLWMTLTAPLFFHAFSACLVAFGYPDAWLPQRGAPFR